MNNVSSSLKKDVIIIISIIIVFLAVVLVFYTEILKNRKIKDTKINYDFVKEELSKAVNKCSDKEQSWIFGIPCEQKPTTKIISDYFNETKNLTNPYDGLKGVEGTPGSVQIDIQNELLILSIDFDISGGIDIDHKIAY